MALAEYELYKRIKLLGEGSFGKAYLVECLKEGCKCVIKQMDMNKMTDAERKETLKEAKILEALKHPNIIRFREVYKTKKGKLCLVMDYADGGDLASRIRAQRGVHFSEQKILDWFTQMCLALKHVHDRKILHRDLKCPNIFLTKNDICKLGDFGIAKVLNFTLQNAKTIVGTPYYISPEIIENRPYSFSSDIWSLGVLLYELCALRPPFLADKLHFLAMKIVKGQYTPIPPLYSKELRNLVDSLLQVNPGKRPTITQILAMPVIQSRIKSFLSESQRIKEFSHTILHNQAFVDLPRMNVGDAKRVNKDELAPIAQVKRAPVANDAVQKPVKQIAGAPSQPPPLIAPQSKLGGNLPAPPPVMGGQPAKVTPPKSAAPPSNHQNAKYVPSNMNNGYPYKETRETREKAHEKEVPVAISKVPVNPWAVVAGLPQPREPSAKHRDDRKVHAPPSAGGHGARPQSHQVNAKPTAAKPVKPSAHGHNNKDPIPPARVNRKENIKEPVPAQKPARPQSHKPQGSKQNEGAIGSEIKGGKREVAVVEKGVVKKNGAKPVTAHPIPAANVYKQAENTKATPSPAISVLEPFIKKSEDKKNIPAVVVPPKAVIVEEEEEKRGPNDEYSFGYLNADHKAAEELIQMIDEMENIVQENPRHVVRASIDVPKAKVTEENEEEKDEDRDDEDGDENNTDHDTEAAIQARNKKASGKDDDETFEYMIGDNSKLEGLRGQLTKALGQRIFTKYYTALREEINRTVDIDKIEAIFDTKHIYEKILHNEDVKWNRDDLESQLHRMFALVLFEEHRSAIKTHQGPSAGRR